MSSQEAPAQPHLRVVKGDPSAEELAALVTVVAAVSAAAASAGPARKPRPEWSHPARGHRSALSPGLGGWRASGLPR